MAWTHEVYSDAVVTETLRKRVVIQFITAGVKLAGNQKEIEYGTAADLSQKIRDQITAYTAADAEKAFLPKKGAVIDLTPPSAPTPTALDTFAGLVQDYNTKKVSLSLGAAGVSQKTVDDALAAVKAAYVVDPSYAEIAKGLL